MTTNQLKKLLISKIDDINDEELLKAVYKIMDYNSTPGSTFKLSDDQKAEIDLGLKDIENGNFVDDEELQNEIDTWLKK